MAGFRGRGGGRKGDELEKGERSEDGDEMAVLIKVDNRK